MRKFTVFLLFSILCTLAFGQNLQNSNWCFGTHARINLNPLPPVATTSSLDLETHSGADVASVSDANGVLLFYTNGLTVWGKNHLPMPNGTQLYGSLMSVESLQAFVIAPKPNAPGIYYIFTGSYMGSSGHGGLHYSIVDMSLNGGNGDIVAGLKNISLQNHNGVPIDYDYATGTGFEVKLGKITTTLHSDGERIWVVFMPNFYEGANFRRYVYSYYISATGINGQVDGSSPQPYSATLLSNANYPGPFASDWFGSMKISPNGSYLCDGASVAVNLYNFNNTTGGVTFNRNIFNWNPTIINSGYGVEFSPNSQLIYYCTSASQFYQDGKGGGEAVQNNILIFQCPVEDGRSEIIGKFIVPTKSEDQGVITPISAADPSSLQLGIDNRIYLCTQYPGYPVNTWIGIIQQPNVQGIGCGFIANGIQLASGTLHWGSLPQWVQKSTPPSPWVWMKGDNIPNQPGVYGTQGVPSASNKPGHRYESCTWVDASGNYLWLFGGYGGPVNTDLSYNDLWRYNLSTNEWTWMKGTVNFNQPGIYGTQGVSAPANYPGSRSSALTWVDASGNLWMFGGRGVGNTTTVGHLNDLWKYSPSTNQWTWVRGSAVINQTGIYGTQGSPSPLNNPGSRGSGLSWKDNQGNFWIFGGYGYSAQYPTALNDLWKYNPGTNQWTWMRGDNHPLNNPFPYYGVYGVQGVESSSNFPGSRYDGVAWTDQSGNFWLHGGIGWMESSVGNGSDLWRYNVATNNWTWMKGDKVPYQNGVYGTLGVPSVSNKPGARENGISWTDAAGNFWLYGGHGQSQVGAALLNDLWKLNPFTGEWTWIDGSNTLTVPPNYGTQGIGGLNATPGGRYRSCSWIDGPGNLWLFGGAGGSMAADGFNDLWKYRGNCTGPGCRPSSPLLGETNNDFVTRIEHNNENAKDQQIKHIEIYSSTGQLIQKINDPTRSNYFLSHNHNTGLGSGIYFIRIIYSDLSSETIKRFMKN